MTDAVAKKSYLVLVFTQNSADKYYTNWTGGWTDGMNNATVVPSLSAKLLPNSGGIHDQELEIDFNAGDDSTAWLDGLTSGVLQAPVTLQLKLGLIPFGPGETETEELVELGKYRLIRGIRNADREPGRMRIGLRDHRGLLQVPLGIPCTPACAWSLGDKTCAVDTSSAQETGTISAVSGKTITLTNPTDSAVVTSKPDNSYWQRGFATVDSLSIGIRKWEGGGANPYQLLLVNDAPAAWASQTVTLTPGCDKTPAICDSRWSNLEKFGGFGIAIPRHHPVTELPS